MPLLTTVSNIFGIVAVKTSAWLILSCNQTAKTTKSNTNNNSCDGETHNNLFHPQTSSIAQAIRCWQHYPIKRCNVSCCSKPLQPQRFDDPTASGLQAVEKHKQDEERNGWVCQLSHQRITLLMHLLNTYHQSPTRDSRRPLLGIGQWAASAHNASQTSLFLIQFHFLLWM